MLLNLLARLFGARLRLGFAERDFGIAALVPADRSISAVVTTCLASSGCGDKYWSPRGSAEPQLECTNATAATLTNAVIPNSSSTSRLGCHFSHLGGRAPYQE